MFISLPESMLKRNPHNGLDDLASEFDYASEVERKKQKRSDFLQKEYPGEPEKQKRADAKKWFQEEHGRLHRNMSKLMHLNAYQRHKEMINLYYLCYEGSTKMFERDTSKDRTDYDVLKDNHKFLWDEEDLARASGSYETRLAKKYYDKLFKEYCICDLSRYKKNQIAMRWRTETEVKSGKGQFICGARKCDETEKLTAWEVNFKYQEKGESKSALVKVRLCETCSLMLNYASQKRKVEKKKKEKKRYPKHKKYVKEEAEDMSGEEGGKKGRGEASTSGVGDDGAKKSTSNQVWQGTVEQEVTRTVDDDIDQFLDDLFD